MRIAAGLLVACLAASGCSGADGDAEARTFFNEDQLQLETPTSAVEELIAAHADDDFLRALLIFSPRAQEELLTAANNQWPWRWQRESPDDGPDSESVVEHTVGGSLSLARWMGQADEAGLLYYDLDGASVISATENGPTAEVAVRLDDGAESLVRLQLVAAKWRVAQLTRDGEPFQVTGSTFLVGSACESARFSVYDGVDCPTDGELTDVPADVQARVDELVEAAGDDINKQIDNAQVITGLLNSLGDARLCARMQGRHPEDPSAGPSTVARGAQLLETTCPGDLAHLNGERSPASLDVINPSSIYGRLSLETPEEAVETFVGAWRSDAHLPVMLMLDPDAQSWWRTEGFPWTRSNEYFSPTVMDALEASRGEEHSDRWSVMLFVRLMELGRAAGDLDHLALSAAGETSVGETIPWLGTNGTGTAVVVEWTSAETVLYFAMTQSASERWRVAGIAFDPSALAAGTGPFPPAGA